MQNNASFLAMIEQPCMISRLTDELREALREFREDPMAFVTTALKRDAVGSRRKMLLRVGLAIAILFYAIAFVSMLVFWSLAQHRARVPHSGEFSTIVLKLPGYWPKIEIPSGEDKPGGGGGGGHQTNTPPSDGELPISSLTQLVIAPKPEPQLTPPALPVIEKVMVDPRIQFKHDDLSPTGLPDGTGLIPSAGTGSDRGMGTGPGGGMGTGDGPGVGPGSGGNTGGESFKLSGARKRPAVQQSVVDERPVLLNRPRPMFTEEARRNKIQGVVRMKILIDVSGKVTEVVVTRGLPDGLDLQAIRAAYQMRFRPAMKNGSPVPYWLSNVEVEFNLR
ncbi:MAG: energy transducer TonB [Acidobacteriota bacterium]